MSGNGLPPKKPPPGNYGRKYPTPRLTKEQVAAIFTACGTTPLGLRDQALLVLAYRAGLEQVEARAARVEEVQHQHSRLRVIHNGRVRTVGLDPKALAILDRWLAVRATLGGGGRGLILCSFASRVMKAVKPDTPMPISDFRQKMQEVRVDLGLPESYVHYPAFRNTLFAELVEEGKPLDLIQDHLGLETLQAAERYLKRLQLPPPDTARVIADRSWDVGLPG